MRPVPQDGGRPAGPCGIQRQFLGTKLFCEVLFGAASWLIGSRMGEGQGAG